jgi:hypothetical protein
LHGGDFGAKRFPRAAMFDEQVIEFDALRRIFSITASVTCATLRPLDPDRIAPRCSVFPVPTCESRRSMFAALTSSTALALRRLSVEPCVRPLHFSGCAVSDDFALFESAHVRKLVNWLCRCWPHFNSIF